MVGRTGDNPVRPRTLTAFMGHSMSHLSATTSAKTALAAPTPAAQNLNPAENRVSTGDVADMPTGIETAIGSIANAASTPGETTTNLRNRLTSNLSDSLTTGVGSLVDASMSEATTKLARVHVEPQLGERPLRLSEASARLILKLFEL
jgi:flagellin